MSSHKALQPLNGLCWPTLSVHALARADQRSISTEAIALTLEFGRHEWVGSGLLFYCMDSRSVARASAYVGPAAWAAQGVCVLIEPTDRFVCTVFRNRACKRRWKPSRNRARRRRNPIPRRRGRRSGQ